MGDLKTILTQPPFRPSFARKLGVSVATLNRLESCRQNVTLKTVK
jgi:transcriptional regulator with XRE-family HTH domain